MKYFVKRSKLKELQTNIHSQSFCHKIPKANTVRHSHKRRQSYVSLFNTTSKKKHNKKPSFHQENKENFNSQQLSIHSKPVIKLHRRTKSKQVLPTFRLENYDFIKQQDIKKKITDGELTCCCKLLTIFIVFVFKKLLLYN